MIIYLTCIDYPDDDIYRKQFEMDECPNVGDEIKLIDCINSETRYYVHKITVEQLKHNENTLNKVCYISKKNQNIENNDEQVREQYCGF